MLHNQKNLEEIKRQLDLLTSTEGGQKQILDSLIKEGDEIRTRIQENEAKAHQLQEKDKELKTKSSSVATKIQDKG